MSPKEAYTAVQVQEIADARLPTRFGDFRIRGFVATANGITEEAVALLMGDLQAGPPLLRIHSQCLTGDVFHSLRCDCRDQLELALELIAREGRGLVIYEQKEGRGIGLMNKLRAYALQDAGADTVEANQALGFAADLRDYAMPAAILHALGIAEVRLLSNNPDKIAAVEGAGIRVVERVPIEMEMRTDSEAYMRTKKQKLGHLLDGV